MYYFNYFKKTTRQIALKHYCHKSGTFTTFVDFSVDYELNFPFMSRVVHVAPSNPPHNLLNMFATTSTSRQLGIEQGVPLFTIWILSHSPSFYQSCTRTNHTNRGVLIFHVFGQSGTWATPIISDS